MLLQERNFKDSIEKSHEVRLTKLTNPGIKKYALPGCRHKKWCTLQDFLFCKADGNYTMVFFANGTQLMISKTMSEVVGIFPEKYLVRPHHSFVLNITHILSLDNQNIVIKGDTIIPISRRKRREVFTQIANF